MLKPDYVVGFVDADGNFHIAVKRSRHHRVGFQVFPLFNIGQTEQGHWILEELKNFFGCGKVVLSTPAGKRKDGYERRAYYQYQVYSLHEIVSNIISFFDEYPPILKGEVYEKWREIIGMMQRKEHLSPAGLNRIIFLKKFLKLK